MDAARYARVRELFLAAEELSAEEQEAFLKIQTDGDPELFTEVQSLLAEHDAESAKMEGERAMPVPSPPTSTTSSGSKLRRPLQTVYGSDTTQRGDSVGVTKPGDSAERGQSEITRYGSERTHAFPRHGDTPPPRPAPGALLWQERTRKSRRRTSGWLWLAALLPTALIGWWTYRQVESTMHQSVQNELTSVADTVALASDRYLKDKFQLVESWSRQPGIRDAILKLSQLSRESDSIDLLRNADETDQIQLQLRSLSAHEDVKFVVWNDSYKIISSWLPDRADVGNPVHPSGASNLTRVMAGETVLFGPERLRDNSEGFVPETDRPVMAIIVPVANQDGRIAAALLVRGIGMYDEFSQMFVQAANAGQWDAYAVNADGTMLTASPNALSLSTQNRLDLPHDDIACTLRVANPGVQLTSTNLTTVNRSICPLTKSVAEATLGRSNVQTAAYQNYAGHGVVGAWRWNPDWKQGIIIEQDAESAFAAVSIVRYGFLSLGAILALTVFTVAAQLAKISTAEHAAVHPLSRYKVLGELGTGGMGVVYRVRHRQLGRDTALKVLRGDRHSKEDQLRFDREAKLAASLSNPHTVTIYDYGRSEGGESFCVMELLTGLTLQEVVARSGYQPIGRVLFIISQVCDALVEAHSTNLVHRDIKPQNIMLSLDASVGDWAVVFDFGLAKPLESDTSVYQTSETIWAGTPMYMAPERFRAPSEMDPRSDIYSVGCVAYYLLSGRPPFIESDPESLFALIISEQPLSIGIHRGEELPDEISEMVVKCMAKSSDDRFATMEDLSKAVDQLRTEYPWSVDEARQWWKIHGGT
jgi:tRNA A-37 threonylcarbamoyl transferase component Bud32